MTAWAITAVILIIATLATICGLLCWEVHDLHADLDLATQKLIEVLEHRGDPRKLIRGLNGYAKQQLPPGHPD